MKQKENKKYNAIEKAILTLLVLSGEKPSWGVRELSQTLGFSPATVQRILKSFRDYGFVKQDSQTRKYHLGNVFYRFLAPLQGVNQVTRGARVYMEQVAEQTRETVHLNIPEDNHRICIDTLESPMPLRAGMPLGHTSPLHAGASAKCLLAFASPEFVATYLSSPDLEQLTDNTVVDVAALKAELVTIRRRGYAQSLGERTPGLGSLSAPVLNHQGKIIASLSLALPEIRFSQKDHRQACISALVTAAQAFSREQGYYPDGGTRIPD